MKKSIKKSKKIIILSVVLLALFCCNAFKSANFSTATTVSAEEPSRAKQYYSLNDLQINNVYEPCYSGVLKWSSFQITGQGSFTVDEKIVQDIGGSGINAILSNYYNNMSGPYGEAVNITASTELQFDAIGLDAYLFAVMDFYDNTKNTTDYICQFINVNLNPKIMFKDITINGNPFPTDKDDPNIERYSFGGVSLYKVTNSANTRKSTLQPFIYGFNEKTGYDTYTSRNAFLLFSNVSMYDYDPNRNTLYKFNTLVGQISTIQYGSESVTPVQQSGNWYTSSNNYRIAYTEKTGFNYYVLYDDGNAGYYINDEGNIYYISDVTEPENTTQLSITYIDYGISETVRVVTDLNDISTPFNLLKTNTTGSNTITAFLDAFKAMIFVDVYTPAPIPEPEPEPEKPAIDYNKIVERAKDKAIQSGWWIGLLGITLGPLATVLPIMIAGADAALYGLGVDGTKVNATEAVKYVITHPIDFLKAFFYSIGTFIHEILETIKNTAFGGNNLLFIIVLIVVALIFIGRDGGIIYYIKNKKE